MSENRVSRRRFLAFCGSAAAGGALYAFGFEPTWLKTVAIELPVPRLPAALDGYRIAQVSDLHVGSGVPLSYLEEALGIAAGWRPDLVAVTGDLTDEHGSDGAAADAAALLGNLAVPDGVCAVLGNHDTGAVQPGYPVRKGELRRLLGALDRADVAVLRNEARVVERAGARLRVAGFGDLWSGHFDPSRVPFGAPLVALSHNPDTAPDLARRGADVILCGHTHGGQVKLPLFGPPYVPVRRKEFLKGRFDLDGAQLYVNPGLGYTHRVRFCARPEVTLLTLRARKKPPGPQAGGLDDL